MGSQKRKLPRNTAVELLKHMSEEGRFEQTLSEFPNFDLKQIRETFAWIALQMDEQLDQGLGNSRDSIAEGQKTLARLSKSKQISSTTKEVLNQLSPQESYALLKNFGAL